ncbi:MAG: pyruvate, phosphate dikinase [Deltaproteobacteria bacterium]|jgi:pyruvate,orthophosphate dikinase|nr:pyruvate, phosphate dikinase [Deltaproteobacteria bacterium]
MAKKLVYSFGGKKTDGHGDLKDLLGGKGANLAEMACIGLPVPPGFTITTDVCRIFYDNDKKLPDALEAQVDKALAQMEKVVGTEFGSVANPLLVSCRSGARVSMPGMMDTVLNIGLNDETIKGLIDKTANPRFAYDSYRRFVAMYGDVVMGVKAASEKSEDPFDVVLSRLKKEKGYNLDTELTAEDLESLVASYKELIFNALGERFPEDPRTQLWGAIKAVFNSWMIPRAQAYRQLHGYPEEWGTAVNVQAMVFGNMGPNSATGVAFSRDPSTGENYFYGEYLINAQGEDVVAGTRTPIPINRNQPLPPGVHNTLEDEMPELYKELNEYRLILEDHYRDMQDIEFTIQEGKLWMLQCRNGKRTAHAALKIAVDLVKEKYITAKEAILRIQPDQLTQILLPIFDANSVAYRNKRVIGKGLAASPGAAGGKVCFSASEAEKLSAELDENGNPVKVILVRVETSPEDIRGMFAAQGILTSRGGMTSHAAVVARGMGRPCVAGSADISVNYETESFTTATGDTVRAGDWISLDGGKGEIILGELPTINVGLSDDFGTFMDYVAHVKKLKVRTNADTPRDAAIARSYGAEGIGLCRTEHMFFEEDRIDHIRAMILAEDLEGREAALARLLPMQRSDFHDIFKAMDGLPVTIRTLDPPLHEFLPHTDREIEELAQKFGLPPAKVKARCEALKEQNPMLGLRGCRLGILFPEITATQARAIFEAACQAAAEGVDVRPEIMVPLVGHPLEFTAQKAIIDKVAEEVLKEKGARLDYLVGTMIELPRAALEADKIAKSGAQFFSFGTNDLTQTTFGLSRDDSGSFLNRYLELGVWRDDPFVTLDQDGVGQLILMAVDKGRATVKKLKIGICGEHGGDPKSVKFCCDNGFDYVSCSPLRVPLARLAAAQYLLEEEEDRPRRKPGPKPGPRRKPGRPATRKTAARKPAARKTAARKPAARKTAARKPATRKTATRRAPARQTATRRAPARKTAARKPVGRPPARKTTARKPAARKTAARKPAARTTRTVRGARTTRGARKR